MNDEEIKDDLIARDVRVPSQQTLAKYGLSLAEWYGILQRQAWKCPICKRVPMTGQYVVDHDHSKGWARMPAAKRKLYVRGLLDWWDNKHLVGRGATPAKLRNAARYLENYERRLARYREKGLL